MAERELALSCDMSGETLPITALCIVADKNKCPNGFSAIMKTQDDGSDADLWRESAFSIFSRPVRYIAVSREDKNSPPASRAVVTDLTVVKDNEPVPHGYIAVDYTADSREKALRKRFLCVKTEKLESCVDALTEVIVLARSKKTPKDYTLAGEVDGILVCFKTGVIPKTYSLRHSASEQMISGGLGVHSGSSVYPGLSSHSTHSSPLPGEHQTASSSGINAFTIKTPATAPRGGLEDVPFVVNPLLNIRTSKPFTGLPELPDVKKLDGPEYNYAFNLERSTLVHN